MNMAEIRWLEQCMAASLTYWTECRDTLFAFFIESTDPVLLHDAAPDFRLRIYNVFQRLVRLLLCFETEIINKVCIFLLLVLLLISLF